MYKIIFLILIVISSAHNSSAQQSHLYEISNDKIRLEFTTEYTFDDLVMIKEQLAELDILIGFTSLKFTDNGYLMQISAWIEYPDSGRGTFTSRILKPGDKPGFRRDFRKWPLKK